MFTQFFCLGAFLLCWWAGNRSLKLGLCVLFAFGYLYGIVRANYPDTWTYLSFDAAVIGLYVGQLWRPLATETRLRAHDLRLWMVALMAWPILLFVLFPGEEPLVELVGLRANIFLIPFLLLGARLADDEIGDLAVFLAFLNLAVVAVAVAEFFVGVEPFYPANEVTEIVYKSNDLVGRTALRIPGTFSSAHPFAGTMAMTLPLLIGAWLQPQKHWKSSLLAIAIIASLLGIFMAAARSHMVTAALLVAFVTFSGRLKGHQWMRWAFAVGLVGYLVAGEERLQRFTTLKDTTSLAERWGGSVNEGFFDVMKAYPLGNGLAGGGTSVPHFLRSHKPPRPTMENEYARIGMEQGLPGLALWLLFLFWVLTRMPRRLQDEWVLGRRLAWVACLAVFFSGLLGVGLLITVPQTAIMLMNIGWFAAARKPVHAVAYRPRSVTEASAELLGPASAPATRGRVNSTSNR